MTVVRAAAAIEASRRRRLSSSLTNPQAGCVSRKNTLILYSAYIANYLHRRQTPVVLVDAEGTRTNRIAEIAIAETMIERVKDRFNLRPRRLAGDTVYGAVRLLKWLVDRQMAPHIPVWDKSARSDGTFSRAQTWSSTDRATSTSARMESCCTPPEQSSTAVSFAIVPAKARL